MHLTVKTSGAILLALLNFAFAQSSESVAELVGQLKLAPTNVDRIGLLQDSDFVFDFLHSTTGIASGAGGEAVEATAANFPAVIGNGLSMAVGFIEPCGMNTPHTHPRAAEIFYAVNGTFLSGMLAENGARFVLGNIPPGSASIFPKGSIHFQQNNGCEPAMFVAAFNDEDPGVNSISQRYFGLPPDIVGAALGGLGVEEVAGLEEKIPDNIAVGSDECLQTCGITRPSQPTTQRQPRVSGNALPSGFSGPPAPSSTPATSATVSSATSTSSGAVSNSANDASLLSSNDDVQSTPTPTSNHGVTPVLIALIVINGIFVVVMLVALALFIRSRRQPKTRSTAYIRTGGPSSKDAMLDSDRPASFYDPYSESTDSKP